MIFVPFLVRSKELVNERDGPAIGELFDVFQKLLRVLTQARPKLSIL